MGVLFIGKKVFYLSEKYSDKRYAEGWEDENKVLNVFDYDSNVDNLSTKSLTYEKETTNICKLEMIKPGMEIKRKLGDVDSINNEGNLGHLKFDVWEWPKRKKPRYTNCKFKSSRWKFDTWKWPNRKKKLTHQLVHLILLMNDKLNTIRFKYMECG
ncbi:hypothetical protein Tco_0332925 [Tanacetum coccineum]